MKEYDAMLKLYLLTQSENDDYDTYDSVVVAAESEEAARMIHPRGVEDWPGVYQDWASSPDNVSVKLIGTAVEGTKPCIILASFNAG